MAAVERIVDPYPEAREAMNAAYQSLITAASTLRQPELTGAQKRELASILSDALKEVNEAVHEIRA